jgi:hypothetical protein
MSAWTAIVWTLIAVASMWACFRLGIRDERERWVRRVNRHVHRRLMLSEEKMEE